MTDKAARKRQQRALRATPRPESDQPLMLDLVFNIDPDGHKYSVDLLELAESGSLPQQSPTDNTAAGSSGT